MTIGAALPSAIGTLADNVVRLATGQPFVMIRDTGAVDGGSAVMIVSLLETLMTAIAVIAAVAILRRPKGLSGSR